MNSASYWDWLPAEMQDKVLEHRIELSLPGWLTEHKKRTAGMWWELKYRTIGLTESVDEFPDFLPPPLRHLEGRGAVYCVKNGNWFGCGNRAFKKVYGSGKYWNDTHALLHIAVFSGDDDIETRRPSWEIAYRNVQDYPFYDSEDEYDTDDEIDEDEFMG